MLFLFVCQDGADKLPLRYATRVEHLQYMIAARERIVFGGPFLGAEGTPVGSVFAMDFPTVHDAEAWLADEPYTRAGLFEHVTLAPMRQMVPELVPDALLRELDNELARPAHTS
jgi:uncharacterized protein YciI